MPGLRDELTNSADGSGPARAGSGKRDATGEPRPVPDLIDLIDAPLLQSMMDDFYELTRIPMSIIDLEGRVLVGAGWQDVCIDFHRVNPQTCAHCVESDTILTADIPAGEARLYHCKNGMWDAATPIMVGSEHLGNVFTGQFFFDDEPIDREFFLQQAKHHGFDQDAYLAALDVVPRLSREHIDTGLKFLTKLSSMISQLGLSNAEREQAGHRLETALAEQRVLTERITAEQDILQAVIDNTDTNLAYLNADFEFLAVNDAYARASGRDREDLIGKNHFDLFPNAENEHIFTRARDTGEPVRFEAKPFEFPDQPWRGVTYWNWRLVPLKRDDGVVRGLAFSLIEVTPEVRDRAFGEALTRLNSVIHANVDVAAVLRQLIPLVAEVATCETVTVTTRQQDGRWVFREVLGLSDELVGTSFEESQLPITMRARDAGRPVVARFDEPDETAAAGELGLKSVLVAPLIAGGVMFGALSCGYLSGPGAFDEKTIDFVGNVASSLSLAWETSRLFGEEQHAARVSDALAKVNEILLSAVTVDDVIVRLVGEASEVAGADKSLVIGVNEDRYTVLHVRNVETSLAGVPKGPSYFPAFAVAATSRRPVLIEDNFNDPRTNKEFVVPHGLHAFQLLPLAIQGTVTHVLALAYDEPRKFDESDHRSAERMSMAMSAALSRAKLFETERETARLNEALAAIDQSIHGTLMSEEMLKRVVVEAAEAIGCETSALDILEDGKWVVRYVHRFPDEAVGRAFSDKEVPFAAMSAESRRPVVIDNAFHDDRVDPEIQKSYGVRSVMATPLIVQDAVLGVLFFNFHESEHVFTAAEIAFAERLSASLSLAIANARLYQTERRIAETLQDTLVAIPSRVDGVSFSHSYESATSEIGRVGGDFIDVFEALGPLVGIVVGDVSGKGVEAAVVTSLVRNTLRVHAADGLAPADVCRKTNHVIRRFSDVECFVTVFFGLLDTSTGILRYVNAGHPPGLIVTSDGGLKHLGTCSPVLGAFDETECEEASIDLNLGDRLVLYTDGVTEARAPLGGEFFGAKGLEQALVECRHADTSDITDEIVKRVMSFSDGILRDDVAVLVVERIAE